jgi:selenocysteine lyase/cysteine desulfurase
VIGQAERLLSFSFTLDGWQPCRLAEKLAGQTISVRAGKYHALPVTERLGFQEEWYAAGQAGAFTTSC